MDIKKALEILIEKNGSELFVTVDYPPCLKVNNRLVPISKTPLTKEHLQHALKVVMGEHRYQSFCETMESNYAFELKEIGRFRVSAFFQKGEPGMVIRHIKDSIPTIDSLGLPAILGEKILSKKGLILLTGATGMGKSTSMAALVDHRNKHGDGHIITIEDPIEFIHSHQNCIVTQREVGLDTASYEEALMNALRQAPNLVVIGEIRSTEAMKHTLEFAKTGHLCVATLHANSAYQAFERIIHFFPQEHHPELLLDLSLTIQSIISQQLLPTQDGKGMHAVHEILLNTPRMSELIKEGLFHEISELIERSLESGMQSMDQSLLDLYARGIISYEQAMHHANSANNLRIMIKQKEQEAGAMDKAIPKEGPDIDISHLRVSDE